MSSASQRRTSSNYYHGTLRSVRWDCQTLTYITDFAYVGSGPYVELAKDLDFDFQAGVFQNLFGVFPIEQATDMYQIWEGNFLHYWLELEVFKVSTST
ncbi:DUF2787 family protein [Alteromonas macleodii]|uniref:DUF2787 family protein n=1 Tax=Alteromonas macleodii TaxID=28108 RepID=UPI00313DB0E8